VRVIVGDFNGFDSSAPLDSSAFVAVSLKGLNPNTAGVDVALVVKVVVEGVDCAAADEDCDVVTGLLYTVILIDGVEVDTAPDSTAAVHTFGSVNFFESGRGVDERLVEPMLEGAD
jgi:hypothetical protein